MRLPNTCNQYWRDRTGTGQYASEISGFDWTAFKRDYARGEVLHGTRSPLKNSPGCRAYLGKFFSCKPSNSQKQPDSGRMRADESNSVNGRLRTADKPLFTCCDAQTTNAYISDFNHDWDNREETLYQLGEKMLGANWGDLNLQTIAGRTAFLRACDDKIVAARARARSK